MAFYIDLDTEELRSAVSIARSTNQSLTEAMELLNAVVVHDDWGCAERNAINENTVRNRSLIQSLQSDAESFYYSISYALEQFTQAEQNLNQSFGNVDGPIGQFLSLVPADTLAVGTAGTSSGSVSETLSALGSTMKDTLGGLKNAVDTCSFSDILSAFQSK